MWIFVYNGVLFSFLPGNPTYNPTDFSASEVLDNHKSVLTSFEIQTTDEELDSPHLHQLFILTRSTDTMWWIVLDLDFTLEWPLLGRNGLVYIPVPIGATFTKLIWHKMAIVGPLWLFPSQ